MWQQYFAFIFVLWSLCLQCSGKNVSVVSPVSAKKCVLRNFNGSVRPFKVLVFIDYKFMEMFINWLKFYKEACDYNLESLEIICMERLCDGHLRNNGVSCSPHSFELAFNEKDEKLGLVWTKRLEIVNSYLHNGIDLILSDSDAIWVSDPMPDISKYSMKADVVASRGWWPWPLYHKWGSCLCMGFIYLKANAFNIDLFQKISATVKIQSEKFLDYHAKNITIDKNFTRPDDQLAINYQLYLWNITWLMPEDNYRLKNHNQSLVHKMNIETNEEADTGVVVRNNTHYFVTLLPQMNYVRNCHNQSWSWKRRTKRMRTTVEQYTRNATVAHCRLPTGDSKSKKRYMSTFHLWKLGYGEYEASSKHGYDPRTFVVNETQETAYAHSLVGTYRNYSRTIRSRRSRNRTKSSITALPELDTSTIYNTRVQAILNASSRLRRKAVYNTSSRRRPRKSVRANKVPMPLKSRLDSSKIEKLVEMNEGVMF